MNRIADVVLLSMTLTGPIWAQAVEPVARDEQPPISPADVHFDGLLGQRLDADLSGLMTVPEDVILAGFQHRPGEHSWIGEHVGKWLHAACHMWAYSGDAKLKARIDRTVRTLLATQEEDGYLGTYVPAKRWTSWDVWVHKYCLIGLMTYHQFTGDEAALGGARGIADLLCRTFGKGKRDIILSGTHVGMAATSVMEPMMMLYNATAESKYLDFCKYLVRAYDQPHGPAIIKTLLSTKSVRETANNKAYEMMSNLVGLCELYRATGTHEYLEAARIAWDDIAANQLYVTAGTSLREHFQEPHHLPNTGVVSETCATVTWLQLTIQLLRLTGEAKYADMVERIAFNHLFAAQKPTGEAWCYFTPLEGTKKYNTRINCCHSSGPRGVALLPIVAYSNTGDAIVISAYSPSVFRTSLNGMNVTITQDTNFPADGKVTIKLDLAQPTSFAIRYRVPAWAKRHTCTVKGEPPKRLPTPGSYAEVRQHWEAGDTLELHFEMPIRIAPGEYGNEGSVVVQRGPMVLCTDQRLNPELGNLRAVALDPGESAENVSLVSVQSPQWPERVAVKIRGWTLRRNRGESELKPVTLQLTDYAGAGAEGTPFRVWLHSRDRLAAMELPLLALGNESRSRDGNKRGRIADDDPGTWVVTFNGEKADEDWYAVTLDEPVEIRRVVFMHGSNYHDGGWFDASAGKPKVQVRTEQEGEWQTIATLEGYPHTTATNSRRLQQGQKFEVSFDPVTVYGVRIIGKPACGDNAKQAFSSCAELQAF